LLLLQLDAPQLRPRLSAAMPAAVCARMSAALRPLRNSAGFVWRADAGRALHSAAAVVIG
jgi:hypothetical protein